MRPMLPATSHMPMHSTLTSLPFARALLGEQRYTAWQRQIQEEVQQQRQPPALMTQEKGNDEVLDKLIQLQCRLAGKQLALKGLLTKVLAMSWPFAYGISNPLNLRCLEQMSAAVQAEQAQLKAKEKSPEEQADIDRCIGELKTLREQRLQRERELEELELAA